ncbi:MAG: PKD domain-containing protein [Bacteroidia bacterium]|nr:PKD domain-containing protein [Bacteroidia bacterium]
MKKAFNKILFFLIVPASFAQSPSVKDVAVEAYVTASSSPPTFTISWIPNTTSTGYSIAKKLKSSNTWTNLATLSGTATHYIDNNVTVGIEYEYRVIRSGTTGTVNYNGYGYVAAAAEAPPKHFRGKCILMIANTLTPALLPEINRFIRDLEGDGWSVATAYTATNAPVSSVKSQIQNIYNQDPINTVALILLGRVPVPYSGAFAPDAHPDHVGAWPADVYYADLNGNWTDATANTTPTNPPRIVNTPGDGKFDQSYVPSTTELQIGRIDLSSMSSFTLSESQLLKNYLDKNHDYRMTNFTVTESGLVDDNFGYFNGEAFAANGWRNFSSLVGPGNVSNADYFTTMSSSFRLWSYGCGGGSYTSAAGIGSTANFTSSNLQGVFTILFGSYFGDWDVPDNFLRAPLCQGKMLTCFWAGRPHWWLHHMGLGENIGYSVRITQNNQINGTYFPGGLYNGGVHVALMGDPTLRNRMVKPPGNVTATFVNHNAIINWSPSTQTNVIGYHIYMKNDSANAYVLLNASPVTGNSYTHHCQPYQATYTYMVRALTLENSWSGTYYNLSQGIIDTAYHSSPTTIYANPTVISTPTPNVFQFSCTSAGSYNYQWHFGNGISSTVQNTVHTYSANGTYVATLVVTNACNSKTFTFTINVVGLGLENTVASHHKEIHIFPNPAGDQITILVNKEYSKEYAWKLMDISGRTLMKGNGKTNEHVKINIRKIPAGLYFFLWQTLDGKSSGTERILKE